MDSKLYITKTIVLVFVLIAITAINGRHTEDTETSNTGLSNGESSANKTKNELNTLNMDSAQRQPCVGEYTLERQLLDTEDPIKRESLKEEYMIQIINNIMNEIYKKIVKEMPEITSQIGTPEKPIYRPLNMEMFPCYKHIVDHLTEKCFSVSENQHIGIGIFANICIVNGNADQSVKKIIDEICTKPSHVIN